MASESVRILCGAQCYCHLQHFTLVQTKTQLHAKRMYVWRVPCTPDALHSARSAPCQLAAQHRLPVGEVERCAAGIVCYSIVK